MDRAGVVHGSPADNSLDEFLDDGFTFFRQQSVFLVVHPAHHSNILFAFFASFGNFRLE
jgi:hypothetical protein